jgi:pilus assembly protein CpaE
MVVLLVILASAKPSLSANALATQSVDVNFVEGTLYSALEQVSARKPDVALVECSDDAGDLDQLNKLQALVPHCLVVPVRTNPSPDFLLQLMRNGFPDVLTELNAAVIEELLERVTKRQEKDASLKYQRGQCLGFLSVKGGSGATFIATSLATALSNQASGQRILFIDASLPFGDADVYLNAPKGEHHLGSFHDSIERLDAALFGAMVQSVSSHFDFVPAPPNFRDVVNLDPDRVATLIAKAKSIYDFIFVDIGSDINPFTATLIDQIDQLNLIATADILGVQHAAQVIRFLDDISYPQSNVSLNITRWDAGGLITQVDMTEATGKEVQYIVPKVDNLITKSMSQGRSALEISPRSPFSGVINSWAEEIDGVPKKGKSLWTRLRGK